MEVHFPLYRKSFNEKHYYIIHNKQSMTEVQVIGTEYFTFDIKSTQFPDLMRIKGIIDMDDNSLTEISEKEMNEILKKVNHTN